MKPKIILSYIFLFGAAVCVFLFILFPQEQLAERLNQTLNLSQDKVDVQVQRVKPALPFYLKLENARFVFAGNKEILPQSLKIIVTPDLLFGDTRRIKFDSEINQGMVKGNIRITNTDPAKYTNGVFNFSGIKIEKFAYNTGLADVSLDCNIDGEYTFSKDSGKKSQGNGSFLIQDVSAKLEKSLLNRLKLSKVDFSSVQIEFTQDKKIIDIQKLTAKGSIINLKLKGKVILGRSLAESRIALSGAILPDSPYLATFINSAVIRVVAKNAKKDGIRFSIKGTLDQPKIKL